ncbi:MAG TPA: alpha/beta hydrolase [Thermoleophilaceae bacterium]
MPKHQLPEGIELHYEARGEGPLVVIAHPCISVPTAFSALGDELVSDHRVLVYDPRGCGESTPAGPYDILTDAGDLAGLLGGLGEPAVVVAFGEALHRAVEASAIAPGLVSAVVSPGAVALGSGRDYEGVIDEGLASSPAVVAALLKLFENDYRSGLRTTVEGGNPQFAQDQVQARVDAVVAYSPLEATLGRLRGWISHDSREPARVLGDRLWILVFGGNVWFPVELVDAVHRDVPDARVEEIEDGAVSRPDLTAEIVRRITRC